MALRGWLAGADHDDAPAEGHPGVHDRAVGRRVRLPLLEVERLLREPSQRRGGVPVAEVRTIAGPADREGSVMRSPL